MQMSDDKKADKAPVKKPAKLVAIVLVRGLVGIRADTKTALNSLKIRNKHVCVVLPDTAEVRGQLRKCKDYATYGTITEATKKLLDEKRGPGPYRLHPPRGGWERKGTKKSFVEGGALGERNNMDALITRMV